MTGAERLPDGRWLLHTGKGDFACRWAVNSAGLNSAKISAMLGIPGYVIQPVKGEYFVLDKKAGAFARIPVYPAPTERNTFDTHATPTVDGNVLVGPNSFNVEDGEDYSVSQQGMDGLQESGARMFRHMKADEAQAWLDWLKSFRIEHLIIFALVIVSAYWLRIPEKVLVWKGIIQSIFAFSQKAQKGSFFWIILSQIKKVFFPVFSYR